jgi:hypothetical protein
MNLRDLLIIYLAGGAPFGVYYFLQNRHRTETKILWLKTLFRFVCWIPFALQMVARSSLLTNLYYKGFGKTGGLDAQKGQEIEKIKKNFEKFLSESDFSRSIYEFREIFDRYVGLSVEIQNTDQEILPAEREIFRISEHTNKNLAEICLNRRNRQRLSFHQKLARRDFFEIFNQFLRHSSESRPFIDQAVNLSCLLNDSEMRSWIEEFLSESLQTQNEKDVEKTEKEIWKSDKHKLLPETRISTNLPVMTARANLSGKD